MDETLGLQRVKLALVLDPGKRFRRRPVVGGLEDPPSRIGTYSNFTPVRFSIAGIASWLRNALGLPKSNMNCGVVGLTAFS
jgi:hypothetical protein